MGKEENTCLMYVVFSPHPLFSSPPPETYQSLAALPPGTHLSSSPHPPLPNGVILEDFLSSSKESTIGRRTERLVQSVRRKWFKGSSILAED